MIFNQDNSDLIGAINSNESAIAIVANGNTHAAIALGQYVYIKGHGSLAEGLYKATEAIPLNGNLSSTNVSAVQGGGLNDLKNDAGAGYCKMPDGTLLQWGSSDISMTAGSWSNKTINFPKEFLTSYPNVFVTYLSQDTSAAVAVTGRSKTTATISIYSSSGSGTKYFTWFAVATWK